MAEFNLYAIDGDVLTDEEVHRHRGACNAALNARLILSPAIGEPRGEIEDGLTEVSTDAFDYADAMIREYRRRCVESDRRPVRLYRRLGNLEAERLWIQKEGKRKPAQALVLMEWHELEDIDSPRSEIDIRSQTGVTEETIRHLVSAGMLVRVAEDDDAS